MSNQLNIPNYINAPANGITQFAILVIHGAVGQDRLPRPGCRPPRLPLLLHRAEQAASREQRPLVRAPEGRKRRHLPQSRRWGRGAEDGGGGGEGVGHGVGGGGRGDGRRGGAFGGEGSERVGVGGGFLRFDRNEDGFITAEEVWNVMRRLGFEEGRRLEDCERMIRAFDEDGDGKISFLEFRRMMENAI
ncbi:hypothetical protein HPP92_026457 [Vanilla planifolia]|uniref:EF-hand domain-containing protein n=1 Tax=Vanilla planifolia TaxID=51239 RepID=A0A835U9C8_VANPL|nr:hypothetical protein HPP92_026457 [Vanilla planifolia]